MLVTTKTKTKHIVPILSTKELVEEFIEKVDPYPLDKDIISMTIAEFSNIILDEESYIQSLLNEKLAYVAFGKVKSYRQQMKQLADWMKKLEVKQSEDEKRAAIGVDFPDLIQRMLITVTKFFGLKSFDEAENVKLADYLLIAMSESADIKYQRNYQQILEMRNKVKTKK